MSQKLRVAVLGVGRMGRRHVQAAKELGHEIVGIADQSPEALALAEKEQCVTSALHHRDPMKLLSEVAADCVVVATTAPSHAELAIEASKRGAKFVLCEKPMATSLVDCDRMSASCEKHGTKLAINHQMRFMDQYREPKKILRDAGGFTSVQVCAGNMGIVMNGTHYFEMLRFICEENISEVTAWFSSENVPNPRGPNFVDRAGSIFAKTASGYRLYLDCSADQGHGVTTRFAGKFSQIFVDELAGLMYATVREPAHRDLPTTRYGMPANNTIRAIASPDMVSLTKQVLHSLLTTDAYPSGADGRAAVACAVAAHLSDEQNHRAIPVNEKLPLDRTFPWA